MVNVEVKFLENKATFAISDDGIGFKVPRKIEDLPRKGGMLGLVGMQERVRLLGGKLKLESEPGKGTTISIEVPDST
jgi:signal transduction histidine kinase